MRIPGAVGCATAALLLAPLLGPAAKAEAPAAPCVACEAGGLGSEFDDATWEKLRKGEIVASEQRHEGGDEGERRTGIATGIIAVAPEAVWTVLTDWESYPRFMPNVQETRLRRREGERAWISQHLRVVVMDIRYGTVWTLDPKAGHAAFSLDPEVSNDLAASDGDWRLAPLAERSETLVQYESRVDTGRPVPGFVERALTRRSLPAVVQRLREEVLRRAGGS